MERNTDEVVRSAEIRSKERPGSPQQSGTETATRERRNMLHSALLNASRRHQQIRDHEFIHNSGKGTSAVRSTENTKHHLDSLNYLFQKLRHGHVEVASTEICCTGSRTISTKAHRETRKNEERNMYTVTESARKRRGRRFQGQRSRSRSHPWTS